MRQKLQTMTRLEAISNRLLSLAKGLDVHAFTAEQTRNALLEIKNQVDNITEKISLEHEDSF